jgi:hypothetical protein
MRRVRAALVAAILALLTTSCGYALVGHGMVVDPEIKKIGVPQFRNMTSKAGLEVKITQAVIEELLKRGRFEVVPDATGVNALVDGELTSYPAPRPVGFTDTSAVAGATPAPGSSQASRYEVTLTAKVRYTKVGQAEPIWSNDAFSFREEYDLGSGGADTASFNDRESQALDRLAEAFARSLVASMLEAF